ncbi:MAG: biotin--[acetyl-CoA-carboxylase] ligase [bacterium]|nr:biotin--[acetyl-CoA-carboxylase] ligase [bacterium]
MKQRRNLWGRELLDFEELDSTNLWLLAQARPGLALLARRQTQGRGRLGRQWEAGAEGQLFASFYVANREWPHFRPALTLLVGLAVLRAAEHFGAPDLRLKWPNDLLSGRRKLAGILCEASGEGVVCGIGVNLRGTLEDYPRELAGKLTNFELLRCPPPEPKALFEEILDQAEALCAACARDLAPLIAAWEAASLSLGAEVSFEWQGQTRSGQVLGLSPQGALRIVSQGEAIELIAGEVAFSEPIYGGFPPVEKAPPD